MHTVEICLAQFLSDPFQLLILICFDIWEQVMYTNKYVVKEPKN
jgi:hypothetical protein